MWYSTKALQMGSSAHRKGNGIYTPDALVIAVYKNNTFCNVSSVLTGHNVDSISGPMYFLQCL